MLRDGVYVLGSDKKVYSPSVFASYFGTSDPDSILVVRGSRVLALELHDRGLYDFVEAQRVSQSLEGGFRCPTRDDATILMWAKSYGLNEALRVCGGHALQYKYWTQERRDDSTGGLSNCLVFGDSFTYVDFDYEHLLRAVKDVELDAIYPMHMCSYVPDFIHFLIDYCDRNFIPRVNIPTLDKDQLGKMLACVWSFNYLRVLYMVSPKWSSFLYPFFKSMHSEWHSFLTSSVLPEARSALVKLD